LNSNEEISIFVQSHTDSRAPDEYNMELSISRANEIKKYLISQGIASRRVKSRGYGETRPLNKCRNGVFCSESEHKVNRRTEFLILE